jgi:hypothetical protein
MNRPRLLGLWAQRGATSCDTPSAVLLYVSGLYPRCYHPSALQFKTQTLREKCIVTSLLIYTFIPYINA